MTPAGRLSAVIALLELLQEAPRPADAVASGYFRSRRYIGSKDRTAIAERFYGILRRRARLGWHIDRVGGAVTPRLLAFSDVLITDGVPLAQMLRQMEGDRYGPDKPGRDEHQILKALAGLPLDDPDMPPAVRLECPDWAYPGLARRFGDRTEAELAALSEEAPTDLRVNAARTTRQGALDALAAAGIGSAPTPLSPLGLRLEGRPPLGGLAIFKSGAVEPQDEGSQLAALLVGAGPGMQVCDFCAGAGGKALAMAAEMGGKGRVVACDVSEGRLRRAKERLKRAGVDNVEPRHLTSERDRWVGKQKGKFDRVLIDAPCSGTGAWRRNPDARWRPVDLAELTGLQARILASAGRLTKPGGQLIYVTCSLLPEENEAQVEQFLAEARDHRVLDAAPAFQALTGQSPPGDGPFIHLSPAATGTDGFFIAMLERMA